MFHLTGTNSVKNLESRQAVRDQPISGDYTPIKCSDSQCWAPGTNVRTFGLKVTTLDCCARGRWLETWSHNIGVRSVDSQVCQGREAEV